MRKVTIVNLAEAKVQKQPITMVTAYDATMAKIADDAGVDTILVGDSLGMVIGGRDNTLEVTLEEVAYHCRAVRRGAPRPFLVADMPFMTYQTSTDEAVRNAGYLVRKGRAEAVKLEGGESIVEQVAAIVAAGIPVVGHVGLTPQSVHAMGGFKVQGRHEAAAERVFSLMRRRWSKPEPVWWFLREFLKSLAPASRKSLRYQRLGLERASVVMVRCWCVPTCLG